MTPNDVDFWCIHPGGPKILQAVEKQMKLTNEQTRASWDVLRNYGNMISPTVMFVIEETLTNDLLTQSQTKFDEEDEVNIVAIGFSPGVSVDGALIKCKKK